MFLPSFSNWKPKETTFNVNLGNGEELLTDSELECRISNLTPKEKKHIGGYKNCSSLTINDDDIPLEWDLSNMLNYKDI